MFKTITKITILAVSASALMCYGSYWLFDPTLFDRPFAVALPILAPLCVAPLASYFPTSLLERFREQNTELLLARAAADEADRRRRAFMADVSHELRTPLNAIIGFSELISNAEAKNASAQSGEYADDIRGAGHHLLKIIDDLLDLAKIDAGRYELDIRETSLPEIVADAARLSRSELEAGEVAIDISQVPERAVLAADPRAIRQILVNLFTNAAKYAGAGSTVTLSAQMAGDAVRVLEIRDDGAGFDAEEIDTVMSEFGRVTKSTAVDGAGLGLPLVRKLAELHNAEFSIESAQGAGTRVAITFADGAEIS